MSTPYSVSIDMSEETVKKLTASGFVLYGFKAVQSTMQGGAPLVWFQYNDYGKVTDLSWSETYEAYTSKSKIIPNGTITTTNSYSIDLNQTLEVTESTGIGYVNVDRGVQNAIAINNQTNIEFTCGVSQTQPANGPSTPMCAFPLYGGNLDVIVPIEKVLLTFSTLPVNTGTVIFQAYSPSVLIDLTGDNSRSVSFDINTGWSWGGGSWAQKVAASESLVPLLIEGSSSLASRQLASLEGRGRRVQIA